MTQFRNNLNQIFTALSDIDKLSRLGLLLKVAPNEEELLVT